MDIVVTVAVLAPIVLLFLLAIAVTVHFFWLAHMGRWPPDIAPPVPAERRPEQHARRRRGRPAST